MNLVTPNLRNKFVLIGGAAMLSFGGVRPTNDVDIAASAEAMDAFYAAAENDNRFKMQPDGHW